MIHRLRILDRELALVADLDSCTQLFFARNLGAPGEFFFQIPAAATGSECLKPGYFIFAGEGYERVGIIEEVEISAGLEDWITVRGHEAKGILHKRIVLPNPGTASYRDAGSFEDVVKRFVQTQCGSLSGDYRRMGNLAITESKHRGEQVTVECAYMNLLLEILALSEATGTGIKVFYDKTSRQLCLDTIHGTDRSVLQEKNGRVLFSREYGTLESGAMTSELTRHGTMLYLRSDLETAELDLTEDCDDYGRIEKTIEVPSGLAAQDLINYGKTVAGSRRDTTQIRITVPEKSPLQSDRDYFLGDLCSVNLGKEWHHAPVVGIEELITAKGSMTRLLFGKRSVGALGETTRTMQELKKAFR